jgi:hypothetical protein
MRRLRRGSVLMRLLRVSACLVSLGVAAATAGCAGDTGERVYGFQAGRLFAAASRVRLSSAEEDAIITQAIVAHEMRRP